MTAPALTVVIPTLDKAPRLRLTLACLAGQVGAPPTEVVLVDDGCTDETPAVAEAAAGVLDLRVVDGPRAGRAAARNRGAEHGRAPHLVFLDDDILLGRGFLAAHHAAARPDRFTHGPLRELVSAERLIGALADAPEREVRRTAAELLASTARGHRPFANALEQAVAAMATGAVADVAPWLGCVGANVSLAAAAWAAAGGFDEGFGTRWGCEDLELGLRLHTAGVLRAFEPGAAGVHLTHRRADRWDQHEVNLTRFLDLHPVGAVRHLDHLLGPRGNVGRYVAAVLAAEPAAAG